MAHVTCLLSRRKQIAYEWKASPDVFTTEMSQTVICQEPRNMVSQGVMLEDGEPERTVLKQLMLQRNSLQLFHILFKNVTLTQKHNEGLNNGIFIYVILNMVCPSTSV